MNFLKGSDKIMIKEYELMKDNQVFRRYQHCEVEITEYGGVL